MENSNSIAIRTHDWTGRTGMSYPQFLQAKQFERSIHSGIDRIIESDRKLAERGYQLTSELRDEMSAVGGIIDRSTATLDNAMRWGFSQTLTSLGSINDSIHELVYSAKNPSQKWAFEQFDIARSQMSDGHFPEALRSVQRAIHGYGSNPGFESDFRFHFLSGILQLGDFNNADTALINTDSAEAAFLLSARYAKPNKPQEAGKALLCAARAAYVSGRNIDAMAHVEAAIVNFSENVVESDALFDDYETYKTVPDHAPVFYLKARLHIEMDDSTAAVRALGYALMIEPQVLLDAIDDDIFDKITIDHAHSYSLGYWNSVFERKISEYANGISRLLNLKYTNYNANKFVSEELNEAALFLEANNVQIQNNQNGTSFRLAHIMNQEIKSLYLIENSFYSQIIDIYHSKIYDVSKAVKLDSYRFGQMLKTLLNFLFPVLAIFVIIFYARTDNISKFIGVIFVVWLTLWIFLSFIGDNVNKKLMIELTNEQNVVRFHIKELRDMILK